MEAAEVGLITNPPVWCWREILFRSGVLFTECPVCGAFAIMSDDDDILTQKCSGCGREFEVRVKNNGKTKQKT